MRCESGRHRTAENFIRTKHVVAAGLFARDAGSIPAASTLRPAGYAWQATEKAAGEGSAGIWRSLPCGVDCRNEAGSAAKRSTGYVLCLHHPKCKPAGPNLYRVHSGPQTAAPHTQPGWQPAYGQIQSVTDRVLLRFQTGRQSPCLRALSKIAFGQGLYRQTAALNGFLLGTAPAVPSYGWQAVHNLNEDGQAVFYFSLFLFHINGPP